ncbi:alcohol dehydrogenase [Sulfolobales archaeon HS-7]|nr:alcohol dehydrogenase [Sulfolobales archaeon HS-7]
MDLPNPLIEKDHVLVKPQKVLLDGIENAIYLGFLWVEPSRILGSIGMGVCEDVGVQVEQSLIGKKVVIFPYSERYGGIGIDANGVMSEYSSIPLDVIRVVGNNDEDNLFLPHISIAKQVAEIGEGKSVLILGTGLFSAITALYLQDKVRDLAVFRDDSSFQLPKEIRQIREVKEQWDVLVLFSLRGWIRAKVPAFLRDNGIVVLPKVAKSWPSFMISDRKVEYVKPSGDVGNANEVRKILGKINDLIGRSDDVLSSIPTRRAGVIVDLDKVINNIKNHSRTLLSTK